MNYKHNHTICAKRQLKSEEYTRKYENKGRN